MKCIECNQVFTPVNRGKNQVYCSHLCRQRAGSKRYKERIIKSIMNEQSINAISEPSPAKSLVGMERPMVSTSYGIGPTADNYISVLERLYDAKAEAAKATLEAEMLRKELSEKSAELDRLEDELDEDDEAQPEGFLGQIQQVFPTLVTSYAQQPEATMGFLKASLTEIASTIFGNGEKTQKAKG